jgi:hypothetical protein
MLTYAAVCSRVLTYADVEEGADTGLCKTQPDEKIPFLGKYTIKEVSCGLEHVVALVQVLDREKSHLHADGEKKEAAGQAQTVENLLGDLQVFSLLLLGDFTVLLGDLQVFSLLLRVRGTQCTTRLALLVQRYKC